MTEPTERDIAVARQFLDCGPGAARPMALLLADAREEGRREERARCAKIMDDQTHKADDDGNPDAVAACRIGARRIRSGE